MKGRWNIYRRSPGAGLLHILLSSLVLFLPAFLTDCSGAFLRVEDCSTAQAAPPSRILQCSSGPKRISVVYLTVGKGMDAPGFGTGAAGIPGDVRGLDAPHGSASGEYLSRLDVFVFDADSIGRMDTYSHFEAAVPGPVAIPSGTGPKRVVAVANYAFSDTELGQITCFNDICCFEMLLTREIHQYPAMSGTGSLRPGGTCMLVLEPLMSEIIVESVCCDFPDGGSLEDARIYLTGVNGSCELLRREDFRPELVLNSGRLRDADVAEMADPSMILHDAGKPLSFGPVRKYPMAQMHCYPSDAAAVSAGLPPTRVVIEGLRSGKRVYYPIVVNRGQSGPVSGSGGGSAGYGGGVGRNCRYVLNVTLRSDGADSPDGELDQREDQTWGNVTVFPSDYVEGTVGEDLRIWVETLPASLDVYPDEEDLGFDRDRGLYEYEIDADGKGVTLHLLRRGMGLFTFDAGPPVNDCFLVCVEVK